MNAEILNLAETVTKLELQVRTRFLKLMLSTQNTDKFVSLIDQYLTRFPLSFQFTDSAQKHPAPTPPKEQKGDKKPQQKPTAEPPTIAQDAEENTETENVSQQIQRTRKLTATDRRTIRRSLPVYVTAAKGKTSAPQRLDFLSRLAANPIKALSRSKNTAIIFKHPRLGDISAGSIRKAFEKKDFSDVSKGTDATTPSHKSKTPIPESLFTSDSTSSRSEPVATPESKSPQPQSTSKADQKAPKSVGAVKPTKPRTVAPLVHPPPKSAKEIAASEMLEANNAHLALVVESYKSEFPELTIPDLVCCYSGEFRDFWVPKSPERFETMGSAKLLALDRTESAKADKHLKKIRKCYLEQESMP